MQLQGSHGYRISVSSLGPKLVLLSASKGDVSSDYTVRGWISRHGLKANFGKLGRISVKFHGSPHPLEPGPWPVSKCVGQRPIYEEGSFTGTIRFKGEEGFTAVATDLARGSVMRKFGRTCKLPAWLVAASHNKPPSSQPDVDLQITALAAASKTENRTTILTYLDAEMPRTGGQQGVSIAFVVGSVRELRSRVSIDRSTFFEADQGSVLLTGPETGPLSATVQLPRPFSGLASYSVLPGGPPSWTGSLSIDLPGAQGVPLTGPEFTAKLCRAGSTKQLQRCLHDVSAVLEHDDRLLRQL